MRHSLLDSSIRDASDGANFIPLTSIDAELFMFYCLQTFINNSVSIGARDMKLAPFDASSYEESNELCFVSV